MPNIKIHLAVLLLCGLVGGCASAPRQQQDIAAALDQQTATTPDQWSTAASATAVDQGWLASFNDPLLLTLARDALTNNRNLQAAALHVERARLLAGQAGAALVPAVDLAVGAGQSGTLQNSQQQTGLNVGLQISWEIDVWGRIRAGERAATAEAAAVAADYQFAQMSIIATMAKAYFAAIEAGLQRELFEQRLKTLEETSRIAAFRFENGIISQQDLALAQSDLAVARERLISIEGAQRDSVRALELLLGRHPAADLLLRDTLPPLPPPPAAGLPAQVLERRPDLVAAERRVAAAFNLRDQARAAQLPALSLTSTIGGASSSLTDILNPQNVAWRLAGNLLAPIFDGGVRRRNVEIATIDQEQALNQYGLIALEAFQQVEAALDQLSLLARRAEQLSTALDQARRARHIAEVRYREGEIPLLEFLSLQDRVDQVAGNLLAIERLRLSNQVDVHLALGGSWN